MQKRQCEAPVRRPICRQGLGPRPKTWLIRAPCFACCKLKVLLHVSFLYACCGFTFQMCRGLSASRISIGRSAAVVQRDGTVTGRRILVIC